VLFLEIVNLSWCHCPIRQGGGERIPILNKRVGTVHLRLPFSVDPGALGLGGGSVVRRPCRCDSRHKGSQRSTFFPEPFDYVIAPYDPV